MLNVTPESVLHLVRRALELHGKDQVGPFLCDPVYGYVSRSLTVGEIDIHQYAWGCVVVKYHMASAAAFDYRPDTQRIFLDPGADRYLEDIVRQISELLPLEALAVIEP